MREIKFRAWDKEEKKMIYQIDNGSKKDDKFETIAIDFEGTPFFLIENRIEDTAKVRVFYKGQLELMMFTGLKDKNGKEIYEGDILSNKDSIASIKWGELGGWVWGSVYLTTDIDWKFKIIGNVYENPELVP